MPKKKVVDFSKKNLSPEVLSILKGLSEEQLSYMSSLSTKPEFQVFLNIAKTLIERDQAMVFNFPEYAEPWKLAIFKANARGRAGGLASLIHAIKGAEGEIARRSKEKKRGE